MYYCNASIHFQITRSMTYFLCGSWVNGHAYCLNPERSWFRDLHVFLNQNMRVCKDKQMKAMSACTLLLTEQLPFQCTCHQCVFLAPFFIEHQCRSLLHRSCEDIDSKLIWFHLAHHFQFKTYLAKGQRQSQSIEGSRISYS